MQNETIKKQKIIDEIAKKLQGKGLTKKTIETIFDATLNVISEILVDYGVKKLKENNIQIKLRLYGLGTFHMKKVRPRTYVVPSEVGLIEKKECVKLGFKISHFLQTKLNKKEVSE